MNAPVSRRALLGATAAVGAMALPAVAEAGIPAVEPDAGLLDLIARHGDAEEALCQAEDEADLLLGAALEAHPSRPDMLRWREGDFPRTSYGMGASDPIVDTGERRYFTRGVEWLRRLKPPAGWTREAEARRRGIVEAFDAWQAECHEVDRRVGLTEAERVRRAADEALSDLTRAILATVPTTLAGLAAKVRWAAPEGVPDEAVAWRLRRIAADVLAMAGRGVAA